MNKLLFLLILVISISLSIYCLIKNNEHFSENMINLKHKYSSSGGIWFQYRLGDFILSERDAREKNIVKPSVIRKNFKNSLAALYFNKTNDSKNLNILINIIKDNGLLNFNDNFTMHLRLGDILKYNYHDKKKPAKLEDIINIINSYSNHNIHIYTLIHSCYNDECYEKSLNYINNLKKLNNVELHIGGNADKDFIDMITSKKHISGSGNYSNLIKFM